MKPESSLGVVLLVLATLELVGLMSTGSTIWLLVRTGFVLEGALLLLVKAKPLKYLDLVSRVPCCNPPLIYRAQHLSVNCVQYLGVLIFLLQIRTTNLIPISGYSTWTSHLILLIFSPLVQPGTFLGLVYSWLEGDTKQEVSGWDQVTAMNIFSGAFPLCLEAGEDDQWVGVLLHVGPPADLLLPHRSPPCPLV